MSMAIIKTNSLYRNLTVLAGFSTPGWLVASDGLAEKLFINGRQRLIGTCRKRCAL